MFDPRSIAKSGGTITHTLPTREKITIESVLDHLRDEYELDKSSYAASKLSNALRGLIAAFGSLEDVKDKRILDIACGCNGRTREVEATLREKSFEPWLCRAIHFLGGHAFGVDFGSLKGEKFEFKMVNLLRPGSLDFLPDQSFDAVNCYMLFSSPQLYKMTSEDRVPQFISEIKKQKARLLKLGGIELEFDTETQNR
ncbi:MAG: class I SAM-dependent methyltransferase [Bdellovibrionota bacterium]